MPRRPIFYISLLLCITCVTAAAVLAQVQVEHYQAARSYFPFGSKIAGIPVGGLNAQAAGMRVLQSYSLTPVELHLDGSVIQIDPTAAGQILGLQEMLDSAEELSTEQYWPGYWNFLWNRRPDPFDIPLACTVSAEPMLAYLENNVAPRFLVPPAPARPVLGDVVFTAGEPGTVLELDDTGALVEAALCSPDHREVELATQPVDSAPPTIEGLSYLFKALVQTSGFDGIIEVYFQDLHSGQEINFAYNQGHEVAPEIAFTGASTIKIPVMVSAFKQVNGTLPDDLRRQMELMIDLSDNGSTDEVMQKVLDPNLAPLEVTRDMQALGLQNTFLAGLFYVGAPLLDRIQTPANQRTDLTTDPDMYNQTTPADMGRLLAAIERCSAGADGILTSTFSGAVTQAECQEMTGLLAKNRKGVLLEAGVPEGTQMAHKYGWVTDANDGLMHTASDAAVVYTPGGDFVLTVYLYDPEQLQWDAAMHLAAHLATGAYNFFNLPE
jgi:beta-lactamase class A